MKRILVTGAAGQIGTELTAALELRYGKGRVMATDIRDPATWAGGGPGARLDCLDTDALLEMVSAFEPTTIFHLAAILSAAGEADPPKAYRVNMGGLINVLEAAGRRGCQVFVPSSIAAFGPDAPRDPTPQVTVQRPGTMYGVTKVAGELLCDYYHRRFGVDTRGLRFPGLISHTAPPGGGTTDYAVEIFHAALADGRYTCPLRPETQLDMMYMADAIRGAMELMEADGDTLVHRNAYNIAAMQFTPAELADRIRGHVPDFEIEYQPDPIRQAIADSWPRRIDDSAARQEWGWRHEFDLNDTVEAMFEGLSLRAGSRETGTAKGM